MIVDLLNATKKTKESDFDNKHHSHLSHFFYLDRIECFNNDVHWSKIDFIVEDIVVYFFNVAVVGLSASGKIAEKHKDLTQKYIDVMKRNPIVLESNMQIKMELKTQKERRKFSIVNQRHKMDAHNNIPLKNLFINNENKLLHVAWNY